MADSKKYSTGFEMTFTPGDTKTTLEHTNKHSQEAAFCIAVLGDFSGRDNRETNEPKTIGSRRLIEVDRESLETVLAQFDLEPQLQLGGTAEVFTIPIRSFDDFHPDNLYRNVPVFDHLRMLRHRLQHNSTFADAAKEIQGWSRQSDVKQVNSLHDAASTSSAELSLDNLLDRVVSASHTTQTDAGATMIDSMIKQIVAPYVEPRPDPRQDDMVATMDLAIAEHMRFILHHPAFQALEAAWMGLKFLTDRLETGKKIQIYILDISKMELDADMSQDDITHTGLYKRFCDHSPGSLRLNLLVGNFSFDAQIKDVILLAQLGKIAMQAGAPFVAAANERLAGCESFAITPEVEDWHYEIRDGFSKTWGMLRASPVAEKLALTVPRFLLRTPYGQKSRPIETFKFEEMPPLHCHSCYLWGNGAFVKAVQLAHAFIDKHSQLDVTGLPIHHYSVIGEKVSKPCAEIQLTEQGGRKILQQGLIPIWSVKNSDSVRSSDFCSLAETGKALR